MKRLSKFFLLISILVLFIQSSCKKNNDDAKITSYGPYKFAAKVNGTDFIPNADAIVAPIEVKFYQGSNPANTNLYVDGYRMEKHTHVSLFIKNITGPGHYTLNTNTTGYPNQSEPPHCGMYIKDNDMGIGNLWITNTIETGYIDISEYDLQKNIVKGTFYFKAKSLADGTVVEISKGYFSKN